MKNIMSEKRLALHLGISYWTVRKLRLENKIPYLKIGNRIFYRQETISDWLKQQEILSLEQEKEKENEHNEKK